MLLFVPSAPFQRPSCRLFRFRQAHASLAVFLSSLAARMRGCRPATGNLQSDPGDCSHGRDLRGQFYAQGYVVGTAEYHEMFAYSDVPKNDAEQ